MNNTGPHGFDDDQQSHFNFTRNGRNFRARIYATTLSDKLELSSTVTREQALAFMSRNAPALVANTIARAGQLGDVVLNGNDLIGME